MRSLDERVAYLEGRMEDHTRLTADVRAEMRDLRAEFRDLRAEFSELRSEVNLRFDRLDQKFDQKFTWLVGMFIALLLGLLGVAAQVARLQPS